MSKEILFLRGFPYRGEIYLVDFNRRKGKEIRKVRPALVISNDIQNEHDIFLTLAPLTSDEVEIIRPFELLINVSKLNGLDQNSKILFNQAHSVDKYARCRKYLGQLETTLLKEVD